MVLMNLVTYKIEKPLEMNFILGHSHFIKTVEDVHEAIVNINPGIKFGLAFCEASQKALIRFSGNDDELIDLAKKNAANIACGHSFIIFLGNAFPLNILNAIKSVPEVVRIFCATGNEVEVVIAETDLGRGILGVIDGVKTKGIETEKDIEERKQFLRTIGYKF
jgi:adenosine/AMP kinase